jgi:hypothetical protein
MTDKPSQWSIYDRILADVEDCGANRERIASFERNHGKSGPRSSRRSPFASGRHKMSYPPGCCRA